MEIRGRLIRVLPVESGTSQAGREWKKQNYVIETFDTQYPRKVCFNLFGDRIDQYAPLMQEGADLMVSFDLESREFNGRWYTDVRAYRVEDGPTAAARMVAAPAAGVQPFGAPAAPAQGFGAPAAPAQGFGGGYAAQPQGQMPPAPSVAQFGQAPATPGSTFGAPSATDDLPF